METDFNKRFSIDEIDGYINYRFSELLEGEGLGIRCLGKTKDLPIVSGVFTIPESAKKAILGVPEGYNIYDCANPILISTRLNLNALNAGKSFNDSDISRIIRFFLDIDSKVKIKPLTEIEISHTWALFSTIENFFVSLGLDMSVRFSGNGYQGDILVPDYALDRAEEIAALLKFLDSKYSTEFAKVDTGVFNPSRLMRMPGTLNVKGDARPGAPHRMAQVIKFHKSNERYDVLEILKPHITSIKPETYNFSAPFFKKEEKSDFRKFTGDIATLDIVSLFREAGLYVKPLEDDKHIVLCPNRDQHTDDTDGTSSTVIFERGFNKWPGFKCQHSHCQDLKLEVVLRDYFESHTVDSYCGQVFHDLRQTSNPPILGAQSLSKKIFHDDFRIVRLSELLNTPDTDVEYIVKDLLVAGGFSLLAAKPKVGKTTALRSLAVAVAQGIPWLGRETKKGPVIYLALEEHERLMKQEFKKFNLPENIDVFVHVAPAPQDAVSKLQKLIEEIHPILIIVDTMHKFVRVKDGNSYADVNSSLEPLMSLARENDVHIICTHHLKKSLDGDPEDAILGSTAIFGAFDSLLFLTKESSSEDRIFHTTQRYGENLAKHVLKIDAGTNQPYIVEMKESRASSVEHSILKVIAESPSGLSTEDIKKKVNKNHSDVVRTLGSLASLGKIVLEKVGRKTIYRLPDILPLEAECENSIADVTGGPNDN